MNMSIYVRSLMVIYYYRANMQIRVFKILFNSIKVNKYIVKYCKDNIFGISYAFTE